MREKELIPRLPASVEIETELIARLLVRSRRNTKKRDATLARKNSETLNPAMTNPFPARLSKKAWA